VAFADLLANPTDLLVGDGRGVPRHLTAAYVLEEAPQDLGPVRGVCDLGVELDPVEGAPGVLEGRHGRLAR
jgi:hypothetical protein